MTLRKWAASIGEFFRDRSGNVAAIFALSLVPMAVLSGGAVDYSAAMNARTRLSQALDAAALAAGNTATVSHEDALAAANAFIATNYPSGELGTVQNVTVAVDDATGTVTVRGEAQVGTTMLGLIGIDHITVSWESEVIRSGQNLELVMVLDNTGSMRGSKISALRDSAAMLTDILFSSADNADDVNVGLVPFASTVNVGTQFTRDWWLDEDGRSPIHSENFEPAANRWDLFDTLRNTSWDGCVEARQIPHDIEDTPPDPGQPETLFLPYFAPDEPDTGGFRNNYLNDQHNGQALPRQMNSSKYTGATPRNGGGPNEGCTAQPITPLTSNQRTIDTAIANMTASGSTNIPIGVSWGVRVLSPEMPFTEGADFDDREYMKAMVILTDGENYLNGQNNVNHSDYSGYGHVRTRRLDVVTSSDQLLRRHLNDRTAEACEYAKSRGIRVYTITFQVRSGQVRNLMRDCASEPSYYFDSPSESALRDAFELIAGDLANLRLSR